MLHRDLRPIARVLGLLAVCVAARVPAAHAQGGAGSPPSAPAPTGSATAPGDDSDDKPPRPELPEPVDLPPAPEWARRIEPGAGVVYLSLPLFHDRAANAVSYDPGVGFDIHLRWEVLRFLRFHPYFYNVSHHVHLPEGSLVTETPTSLSWGAKLPELTASTFAFGAQLEPVLWLNDRLRLWLTAGVGWGRMHVPEMAVDDPAHGQFAVDSRSSVFVEFPLGMGVGVDIIERWLTLEYEVTARPMSGQSGEALQSVQAVDAQGALVDVGPVEHLDASFVHALTLALIL